MSTSILWPKQSPNLRKTLSLDMRHASHMHPTFARTMPQNPHPSLSFVLIGNPHPSLNNTDWRRWLIWNNTFTYFLHFFLRHRASKRTNLLKKRRMGISLHIVASHNSDLHSPSPLDFKKPTKLNCRSFFPSSIAQGATLAPLASPSFKFHAAYQPIRPLGVSLREPWPCRRRGDILSSSS